MRKTEIKNIMIVHSDNDFIRVWDWIGKVMLLTLVNDNVCACKVLEDSEDIEKFARSLLPTAIEFLQYKEDKYAKFCRYKNISDKELARLTDYFNDIVFKYNFDETDGDWEFGGSETVIIDLENNTSYIR